jgi:hypothetical protein
MESKEESEQFCQSKFDEFLKSLKESSAIYWEKGDDPPDYYLYLDGVKFAVEVTRLMSKVGVGANKPLPLVIIIDLLKQIVVDVEREAKRDDYLQGTYLVYFSKPIENLASNRSVLQSGLLKYIRDTQNLGNALPQMIYKKDRQTCQIRKQDLNEDKVVMGGPNESKWDSEIIVEMCQLLVDRLIEKQRLLRNIVYPKILLLHDKYPFVDPARYKECMLTNSMLASFHTLFVIQGDGDFFVPYSENRVWLRSPRSL